MYGITALGVGFAEAATPAVLGGANNALEFIVFHATNCRNEGPSIARKLWSHLLAEELGSCCQLENVQNAGFVSRG